MKIRVHTQFNIFEIDGVEAVSRDAMVDQLSKLVSGNGSHLTLNDKKSTILLSADVLKNCVIEIID
jgi:hypothetical protein